MSERNIKCEEIIADELLRPYTKIGKLVEIDG